MWNAPHACEKTVKDVAQCSKTVPIYSHPDLLVYFRHKKYAVNIIHCYSQH